jgi:sec-independent protein translocase protein TatB
MFDIGWSEMALVALIALIVIGPKELPKAMRSLAKWTRKARSMAREFQSGIDDMVREADLDDARKAIDSAKTFDIGKSVEETIDPTGSLTEEAKGLQDEMNREAPTGTSDESSGDDSGSDERAESAEDTGEPEGATVIEHPVSIAPPHSLTPPPEDEASAPEPEEVAAVDGDSTQQRA